MLKSLLVAIVVNCFQISNFVLWQTANAIKTVLEFVL